MQRTNKTDELVFLIDKSCGGGAERVIGMLASEFVRRGRAVTLVLTTQSKSDYHAYEVCDGLDVISLPDILQKAPRGFRAPLRIKYYTQRLWEKLSKKSTDHGVVYKFSLNNIDSIYTLYSLLSKKKNCVVVAFLNHSIRLTLQAAYKLDMRVIVSERNSIDNCDKNAFCHINTYYDRADMMVFQTENASFSYPQSIRKKSSVIPNPIKPGLPDAYTGERNKTIVNFCRINFQKNLPLLIGAFARLHSELPSYRLEIIGDARGEDEKKLLAELNESISALGLDECARILPFCDEIHDKIKNYAMFVSSSDFEGMSNSMLEAMAMGLPTICTDCPAGGAAAVIRNGENGLLTKVGDEEELYFAMKRVALDAELASKLSKNGAMIREELSFEKVFKEWEKVIDGE